MLLILIPPKNSYVKADFLAEKKWLWKRRFLWTKYIAVNFLPSYSLEIGELLESAFGMTTKIVQHVALEYS